MGKSLNDLGLKEEALPEGDLTDLPEYGSFTPPPQPGTYRFQLPRDLSNLFDMVDVTIDDKPAQRIKMIFDKDHPLMIVSSANGKHVGEPFETRLSNVERQRGKKGGDGPRVSDLDYLLKALGETSRPGSNTAMGRKLQTFGGKEFSGDIEYSWVCNDKKNIRTKRDPNDPNSPTDEVQNQPGCGRKYYAKDVPKLADGTTPLQIQCECGGIVRAFANLNNIRA